MKVSILIPMYNSEKYIFETVMSCINQTYQNIEILIFDDGSKDNSLKIAQEFEEKYKNIQVFTHKNFGAQITRNKLFDLSKGDYIQYLDADDILDKYKIQSQIELLSKEDNNAISFCSWKGFANNIDHITINKKLKIYKNYNDPYDFLIDMWSNLEAISPHAWLVHRDIVQKSGGWDIRLTKNQDGEFFARIVSLSNKLIYSKNSIVYYRLDSENSISKNYTEKATESVLISLDLYASILFERKSKKARYALGRVYSNFLFRIYPEHHKIIVEIEKRLQGLGYKRPLPISNNKFINIFYQIIGPYNFFIFYKKIKG